MDGIFSFHDFRLREYAGMLCPLVNPVLNIRQHNPFFMLCPLIFPLCYCLSIFFSIFGLLIHVLGLQYDTELVQNLLMFLDPDSTLELITSLIGVFRNFTNQCTEVTSGVTFYR